MMEDNYPTPSSVREAYYSKQREARAHSLHGSPVFGDANISNCANLRQRFFEKYQSIDCNLLIAYWIMAGDLDPYRFSSIEEAYEKGYNILMELKRKRIVYEDMNKIVASTDSNLNHCRHEQPCTVTNIGFDDFLDLCQLEKITLTNGTLKDEKGSFLLAFHSQGSITSSNRLKYVAYFNAPSYGGMKLLLENVNNPSVLLLRNCTFYRIIDFSFEKLTTLTVLEISGSDDLQFIPDVIFSELIQLQCLNLSGLGVSQLPEEGFSKLKQLRWLIVRSCPWLHELPSLEDMSNLEVLNLSYSSSLSLTSSIICSPKLQMVDLSFTKLKSMPQLETTKLTHLFLRDSMWEQVDLFGNIKQPSSLQLLDLYGACRMKQVDLTQHLQLRKLVLRGCSSLQQLVALEKLESLEMLDVMDCVQLAELQDLSNLKKLEVLILSGTQVKRLPAFANPSCLHKLSLQGLNLDTLEPLASLSNLIELDLGDVKISSSHEFKVDFLQALHNLQFLNLSRTNVAELPRLPNLLSLKHLLLVDCPLLNTLPDLKVLKNLETLELPVQGISSSLCKLVLTNRSTAEESNDEDNINDYIFSHSSVLANDFVQLDLADLIKLIHKAFNSAATATNANNAYRWKLKMLIIDVEYIKKHIPSLNESSNRNKAKELLNHLVNLANHSGDVFEPHSVKLQQLLHTVAKLKLLVPRIQTSDVLESSETAMKPQYFIRKGKENVVDDIVGLKIPQGETVHHFSAYASLTKTQKRCLLCFSIFPCHVVKAKDTGVLTWKSLEIRKKIIIYWWVGEGFIEEYVAEVSEQVIPSCRGEKKKTVEEIGEQILKDLTEKGFIEPVIEKGRETGRCCMHPFVHSFIIEQSKRDGFFDFSNDNTMLTPSFTRSHRACLLKAQNNLLSSCELWAKYTKSPKKLKLFKIVQTLFNINESIINIQSEWFSKMKYLSVLHLGNWHPGTTVHVEVGNQKFLEDLKNMKQLKLFSLQGVSTIVKLPDSICKLTNLIILDLRECHDLEELPAGIGSLKNLTHLDITNCHLITKLPKGVSLLLKLEVLRGFAIYDLACHPQDKKASILSSRWKKAKGCVIHDLLGCKNKDICTFIDLLKLKHLRELSIVVNKENFPDSEELEVLKVMENLSKLSISWVSSFKFNKKSNSNGQTDADQRENEALEEDQGDIEAPKEYQGGMKSNSSGQTDAYQGDNEVLEEDQGDIVALDENQGDNEALEEDHGDIEALEDDRGNDKAHEESSSTCGQGALLKVPESKSSSAKEVGLEAQNVIDQEQLMSGKCLRLMKGCIQQSIEKNKDKKSRKESLDQIEKLELWCFPYETAPEWLVPDQLKNLQKLYIKGGKLKGLPGCNNGNEWKVTTLRLRHLPDLVMKWTDLKAKFPNMKYLEMYECKKLLSFPYKYQGVWSVGNRSCLARNQSCEHIAL